MCCFYFKRLWYEYCVTRIVLKWGVMKNIIVLLIIYSGILIGQTFQSESKPHNENSKMHISSEYLEEATVSTEYALSQNYPNPFNPVTKIKFSLKKKSNVSLRVYNVIGREVCDQYQKELESGIYEYTFDMKNLPSGVYFYKISTPEFINIKKMILLK